MSQGPPALILGAGGHAKVVIELIRAQSQFSIAGLIDPNPTPRKVLGVDVIGSDAELDALRRSGLEHAFVAIGDNRTRLAAAQQLRRRDFVLINAVSPAATVSPTVRLGRGIAIMAGSIVNADARLDDFAIVNTGAGIDHDSWIGEAAHVGPGSRLAGNVMIGRLAFLGVGTNVIPGIRIGEAAVIGAGACVIRDIPARAGGRGPGKGGACR